MAANILLLGANGQVGWELQRSLLPLGEVRAVSRLECDLSNLSAVESLIEQVQPDIIVNAAAYTAVDKAESDSEQAERINVALPGLLARKMASSHGLLVDYSTDYIFDGKKSGAYLESDQPAPLSVYGRTKLDGLRAIEQSGCRYLVFRVSWVYGRRGHNFIKTILRLAREKDSLNIVADQYGVPTPAELIADVTAQTIQLLNRGIGCEGVYNLAPCGETTWFELATRVVEFAEAQGSELKLQGGAIFGIPTEDYPTPAERPKNSRLDTTKLQNSFGISLPDWQIPLTRIVAELAIEK